MIVNNKPEIKQKDVIKYSKEAFDRGGASVLKLLMEMNQQIRTDSESNTETSKYCNYVDFLLEKVRESLKAAAEADVPEIESYVKV